MFLSQRRLDRQNKCLAVDKPQIPQCDYDLVRVRLPQLPLGEGEGGIMFGLELEIVVRSPWKYPVVSAFHKC